MVYLFRECEVIRYIQIGSDLGIRIKDNNMVSLIKCIENWLLFFVLKDMKEQFMMEQFLGYMWFIWILCNQVIFKGVYYDLVVFFCFY